MQKALIIFGRSHSWELDAPSLRKRLQALKRKIHRREANRERDGWHAQAVFDEVTTRRHELITTLGNGLITSYGLIGAGEKDTGALAIPSELYRSPLRLTPEGDICCGLGKAELILWRDVVVRYADIDRLWPEDGNPKDQSASQKQRVAVPKQPVSKTDATRRSSRDDQRASKALAAMKSIQEEAIAARGKPLDIRSLGRELKSRFYFPSRLADQLSPMLSDTHKNRRRG